MFVVGLLPALLVLWVRRSLKEPTVARTVDASAKPTGWAQMLKIFRPDVLRITLLGTLLGTGAHGVAYV